MHQFPLEAKRRVTHGERESERRVCVKRLWLGVISTPPSRIKYFVFVSAAEVKCSVEEKLAVRPLKHFVSNLIGVDRARALVRFRHFNARYMQEQLRMITIY